MVKKTTKTAIVPASQFAKGMVPEGFLPHKTLAKHGAAYLAHGVNFLETGSTLAALRKARVMAESCRVELDKTANKLNHQGVAAMRDLAQKAVNACDGLLTKVDKYQGGKLHSTQLSAATGAITLAATTCAASSALIQSVELTDKLLTEGM